MSRFKVGDKVIANNTSPYKITTNGWKGVVVGFCVNEVIIQGLDGYQKNDSVYNGVKGYMVEEKYFKLLPRTLKEILEEQTNGKNN